MPLPRPPPLPSNLSSPPWGPALSERMGRGGRDLGVSPGWDAEASVSSSRLSLWVAGNRDERRRGSAALYGVRGSLRNLSPPQPSAETESPRGKATRRQAGELPGPRRQRHPGVRRRRLPSARDALHWVPNRSNSTAYAVPGPRRR